MRTLREQHSERAAERAAKLEELRAARAALEVEQQQLVQQLKGLQRKED